jgi:tubulin-specific chaperone A
MADPRIKTLKIKTGVVKRLTKEKLMYIKETEQQREKVEKLKASGKLNFVIFLMVTIIYH